MKPKLILLHGALGSKKQFDTIIPLLEDTFELFTFNFEGHGGVTSHNNYSIQLFTKNTIDFFRNHHIEKAHLFGYSMGGYVALHLAKKEPSLVASIATLATKFNWNKVEAEKQASLLDPNIILQKVPQFAEKLHQEHAPLGWKDVMQKTAAMMLELGGESSLKEDDFKKITVPVHLAVGSEDHMVTIEETQQICKLLPQATILILEKVPHPIDKIPPSIIADFIKKSFLS